MHIKIANRKPILVVYQSDVRRIILDNLPKNPNKPCRMVITYFGAVEFDCKYNSVLDLIKFGIPKAEQTKNYLTWRASGAFPRRS